MSGHQRPGVDVGVLCCFVVVVVLVFFLSLFLKDSVIKSPGKLTEDVACYCLSALPFQAHLLLLRCIFLSDLEKVRPAFPVLTKTTQSVLGSYQGLSPGVVLNLLHVMTFPFVSVTLSRLPHDNVFH